MGVYQQGYVMHKGDTMELVYLSNFPNASINAFCYNGDNKPEQQGESLYVATRQTTLRRIRG